MKWHFNGQVLNKMDDDGICIENVSNMSSLKITNGKHCHSGSYTLLAANEHGKDEETILVNFQSCPSCPIGAKILTIFSPF